MGVSDPNESRVMPLSLSEKKSTSHVIESIGEDEYRSDVTEPEEEDESNNVILD